MKAVYRFEEDLIKEYGEDVFDPVNNGYSADELNAEDRAFIGGLLYALMTVENSRFNFVETDTDSVIAKIEEEIVSKFCGHLKQSLICDAREHILSMIDGYEVEDND